VTASRSCWLHACCAGCDTSAWRVFAEYYSFAQNAQDNGEEIRELINCVTTNKTSFFRERHHFDFLANTVVPAIQSASHRGGSRTIRVWSAASSTGEEAYSIVMTLLEALHTQGSANRPAPVRNGTARSGLSGFPPPPASWKIEVVASDIDTKVLETARRAIYTVDSLAGVATPLIRKYFLRGKDDMLGRLKVKPVVTQLVEFKCINLNDVQWPLEGLFDVVFFRNALIYFNHDTQDRFLRKIVGYLKPRGYLFLGNAEHISWLHGILEPLNRTMYRLRNRQP
jgi:chemotaxis protein methyltransferase CheR